MGGESGQGNLNRVYILGGMPSMMGGLGGNSSGDPSSAGMFF
jgi:hypothetical protein